MTPRDSLDRCAAVSSRALVRFSARRIGPGDEALRPRGLAAAVLLASLAVQSPVLAQTTTASGPTETEEKDEYRAVARRMAEEAAALYQEGKYDEARDLFRRAYALHAAPTLALWEARSLQQLGRLVEAEERYAVVQRHQIQPEDPTVFREAVAEAREEFVRLRERIPTLTITLQGTSPTAVGVQVLIDERPIKPALVGYPTPVDPGTHTVRLLLNGKEQDRASVTLQERSRTPIELSVIAARPAQAAKRVAMPIPRDRAVEDRGPSTRRAVGWIGVGVGGAGLVTGAVAGLLALDRYQKLEDDCDPGTGVCPASSTDDLNAFRALRTVSTVGYVVGAVGVPAGMILVLTAPTRRAKASLFLSPSVIGVRTAFR